MKPFFTLSALDHTHFVFSLRQEQKTGMCIDLLTSAETLRDFPGNSDILWLDKQAVRLLRIGSCVHESLHGSLL